MMHHLDTHKHKKHNYVRDFILVIVGIVALVIYFHSESRFSLNPSRNSKTQLKTNEKLVYAGPIMPKDLKLTQQMLAPVDAFVAKNGKHFKQVMIYIERQDAYGAISDSTELRFYTITRFNDDAEIKSVYTPTTRKNLPARIARRLSDDMRTYFDVVKKHPGKNIKEFTNTM